MVREGKQRMRPSPLLSLSLSLSFSFSFWCCLVLPLPLNKSKHMEFHPYINPSNTNRKRETDKSLVQEYLEEPTYITLDHFFFHYEPK